MVKRSRLAKAQKRKKITRLKRIQKKCPHHQFYWERGKGYICDVCGKPMTPREVNIRRALWMLYLGPDPAKGQGPTSAGHIMI